MLRTLAVALALLMWAPSSAVAEPPPPPNPYLVGPADAPGPGALTGTRWRVNMVWDDGADVGYWSWVRFDVDGQMTYGYSDGRVWTNGRWRQRGTLIVWDTNAMFQVGMGQIVGDRISGTTTNVRGNMGRWEFTRER